MYHYRSLREGVQFFPKGDVNLKDREIGALYPYSTSAIKS